MSETMSVQELVYEEIIQSTGETHFGIDMQSALSGAQEIPPEGVRFDITFAGELTGPKLKGKIVGTDYVLMRGDRLPTLHVHAVITTEDGERISFFGDGIAILEPGSPVMQLRENVTLHTAAAKYAWVNRQLFWATGGTDPSTGQATLKGYSA
jgi:hypothetical protein